MKCAICGKDIPKLGYHIKKHGLNTKDYYDKFIKKENEGKCIICGKPTTFDGLHVGYKLHCSCTCAQLDPNTQTKLAQTNLARYGAKHPLQSHIIQEKVKQTNLDKYGVENVYQSEKIKQKIAETNLNRYGFTHPMKSNEIQERLKNSMIDKYGVSYASQLEEAKKANKETDLVKYGTEYHITSVQCKQKSKTTKLNRHSTFLSKERIILMQTELNKASLNEKDFYKNLSKYYNVVYNTSSEKYPYLCDFYIFDLDLYIELNLTWTHGWHYFDETNLDDVNKLQEMKSKHNDYYDIAIDVWTKKDIEKRDCAIKNNLNYVVLWNKDQIKKFLGLLDSNYTFTGFTDFNYM